jgi:hypothetical protein
VSHADNPLKKKTQEFAAEKMKQGGDSIDAASRAAAEMISAAIRKTKGKPEAMPPAEIVREATHGAMNALLIADLDLEKGAVAILEGMAEVAQENHIDTQELVTWSMEGIARLAETVPAHRLAGVGQAIDAKFMGTAEVFRELCRKAASP